MIKKITFMRVALSFVIAICFGFFSVGSMRVYAYTAEDGFYPIDTENGLLQFFFTSGSNLYYVISPDEDNTYHFNNPDLSNINRIVFYPGATAQVPDQPFNFPADFELYDYYLLGALYSNSKDVSLSSFKPTGLAVRYKDANTDTIKNYDLSNLNIYNIDNQNVLGFGFSVQVDFESADNIGVASIQFLNDVNGSGSKPANQIAEFGILSVPVGTDEVTVMTQILDKLSEMESSITGSIDANTSAINSIGESIVNKLSSVFEELTSDLSSWFSEVKDNLDSNFSALLDQNSEEHEEVINGYQGTGTPEASEKFDQSAGELESVEKDLTNITNSSIETYTDSAFDTSVIASLGSSLVYVVTWFTNFWDMGGLFSSILNVGLALSIAFFILRLRGGD